MAARRNAVWALVDQGLSSGTNVLLPVVGIRHFAASEADKLSVFLSAVFIAVGISRGLLGEAYSLYASRERRQKVPRIRAQMLGLAVVVGVLCGISLGVLAWCYLNAPVSAVVIAVGMMMITVQDACRYAMFEAGLASSAAINDAIWLICFVGISVVGVQQGTPAALVAGWSACGACAGAVACFQLHVVPQVRGALAFLRLRLGLHTLIGAEFVVTAGVPQLIIVAVGLFGPIGDGASYRLATSLLAPAGVATTGLVAGLQPMVVRAADLRGRLHLASRAWFAAVLVLAGCLVVAVSIPDATGARWFGEAFVGCKPLLVALAVASVAQSGAATWGMVMRANDVVRLGVMIRSVIGAAVLVASFGLVFTFGGLGLAVIYGAGSWLLFVIVRVVARRPTSISPACD